MTNELFPRGQSKSLEFPTDYRSILQRIDEIDPIKYAKTRNYIDGAVTCLSPYISRGVISVKQIQQTVLAKGFPPSTLQKFLQELAWREYFQRVWQAKGDAVLQDMKQPQTNVLHAEMIDAIVRAGTGITAVDNAISEFYKSGYLHNHVRMYVASLACNIGRAHWSTPAKWMYYHLLDGDVASNTCSWQWVAGSFSSKKYYCNQDNINHYTHSHQIGTFLDSSIESLPGISVPDALKATSSLDLLTTLPAINKPVIDTSLTTLIYNSYNLNPLWRQDLHANRVLLLEPSHFAKYPVGKNTIDFILKLSNNIPGIQIMVGEVSALAELYNEDRMGVNQLISMEHPAFLHYPGQKDQRDWMYPEVKGYFPSFSSFWKKCERFLIF